MKEESLVESVVEEQTIEEADIAPVSDVLGEVAVVEKEKIVLVYDWSPLNDSGQAGHAEAFIEEILEKIPGLTVKTSKNQHQAISYGLGRGRVLSRFWFCKSYAAFNTLKLDGKAAVLRESRKMPENGFSKKIRAKIISEVRAYLKEKRQTGDKKFLAPEAEVEAESEAGSEQTDQIIKI